MSAWHSPSIVKGARAGQYVHVRTVEAGGLPTRRPFPIVTTDAASGTLTIHGPGGPPGRGWLDRFRPGDVADMIGPLGRPFEVDSRSRHLLLMAEGPSVAAVRLLDRRGRARRAFGDAAVRRAVVRRRLPDEPAPRRGRVRGRDGRRQPRPPRIGAGPRARVRGLGGPGVRGRTAGAPRRDRPTRRRPTWAAGGRDAGAQARGRQATGERIPGGEAQGVAAGAGPAGVRVCRRHVPRDASWPARAGRSVRVARDPRSPPTSSSGRRREGEAARVHGEAGRGHQDLAGPRPCGGSSPRSRRRGRRHRARGSRRSRAPAEAATGRRRRDRRAPRVARRSTSGGGSCSRTR